MNTTKPSPSLGVAIASGTQLAADAGARIASEGGNAVDAAIAASLVSVVVEPGVCSLGGGGYLLIWPPNQQPVTIDGACAMPGRGLPRDRVGRGGLEVLIDYGGGTRTIVGYGSVAVPGLLAAYAKASERFGQLPWRMLVEPAIEWARSGFPLSRISRLYFELTHENIFGWQPESFRAIHDEQGRLLQAGDRVHIPHLAESLGRIADLGAGEFYRGDLARLISADHLQHEGLLGPEDLADYEARLRQALQVPLNDWQIATNPPPAIGGSILAAMLLMVGREPPKAWTPDTLRRLISVQEAVLVFRRDRLDYSDDMPLEAAALLRAAEVGELGSFRTSPSTAHTSAVDSRGLACSVTVSAGYGSGVMPKGTGIWMNNTLGELELNKRGIHTLTPGSRLPSNMAPTIARRHEGSVLAIGSPGADRITTAIQQTLVNHLLLSMPLREAIEHPRLHVEHVGERIHVACEPGLSISQTDRPVKQFDHLSMYFGGVVAARWDPRSGFSVASDSRRACGTAETTAHCG